MRTLIVCECGYKGYLNCEESSPLSGRTWVTFSLEGFHGAAITTNHTPVAPEDSLTSLYPTCPECGKTGKVTCAKGSENGVELSVDAAIWRHPERARRARSPYLPDDEGR